MSEKKKQHGAGQPLPLFVSFLKIGAFTFGGGYAMLPLIQAEVKSHGWLDTAELVDFIAVSESTPGPFAVNISTFVGMRTAGIPGALCATFGVVLPSFLIIILVAKFYEKFRKSSIVQFFHFRSFPLWPFVFRQE